MTTRALAGALVTLLLSAAPAAAQAKPTPCTGMAASDAAGDQVYHVPSVQQPTPQKAPTAADLTGAFFTTTPDGVVRANLVVSDLDTNYPDPATGVRYSIYYKVGSKAYYLRLVLSGEEPTWSYGTNEGAIAEVGKGKGELHKGKDGVVSFVVPKSQGGNPGTAWTDIWSATSTLVPQSSSSSDYLPDGSSSAEGPRFKYDGARCPDSGTTPPPGSGETTPPPGDGGAAPPPSGGGGTPPPSGVSGPGVQPTEAIQLKISAKPTRLRAKKVKRKAVFTLKSNENLTDVRARFLQGRKAVGTGKLAKLPKNGRLIVKVKRKLKKGRYTLILTGRRADGQTGTVSIKITVK